MNQMNDRKSTKQRVGCLCVFGDENRHFKRLKQVHSESHLSRMLTISFVLITLSTTSLMVSLSDFSVVIFIVDGSNVEKSTMVVVGDTSLLIVELKFMKSFSIVENCADASNSVQLHKYQNKWRECRCVWCDEGVTKLFTNNLWTAARKMKRKLCMKINRRSSYNGAKKKKTVKSHRQQTTELQSTRDCSAVRCWLIRENKGKKCSTKWKWKNR